MRTRESVELILIVAGSVTAYLLAPFSPPRPSIGTLSLIVATLILFQSLVRDVALILIAPRGQGEEATRVVSCMCVESMMGFVGVMLGVIFLFTGNDWTMDFLPWGWPVLTMMTWTSGFLLKDWVVTWQPWGIKRERDHLNLIVRWRN